MENKTSQIFKIRTIKIENSSSDIDISSVIDCIKYYELESITVKENVYYLNFFEYFVFYLAYNELINSDVLSSDLDISYVESEDIPMYRQHAYQAGASRSIYFSNITDDMDEKYFMNVCSVYGQIENMIINREKKHAQIRFFKFENALNFMENATQNGLKNKRYGFHRPKQHNKAFHTNRTLYLGNVHNEVTASDVLNHCMVGTVFSLKFLRDKKCAFLTFVNPHAAETFLYGCLLSPLVIKNNKIKVTHGNNSNIPMSMIVELYHGATRSIQIDGAGIENVFENLESTYRKNGNTIYNFTSIHAAVKAMNDLKSSRCDRNFSFVPDRCAIMDSTEALFMLHYDRFVKNN